MPLFVWKIRGADSDRGTFVAVPSTRSPDASTSVESSEPQQPSQVDKLTKHIPSRPPHFPASPATTERQTSPQCRTKTSNSTSDTTRDTTGVSDTSFSVRCFLRTVDLEDSGPLTRINTEFDFRVLVDGRSAMARYANNSNYRNDSLIRKESGSSSLTLGNPSLTQGSVCVSSLMIKEIKRIIKDSEIMKSVLPLSFLLKLSSPLGKTGKMMENGHRRTRMDARNSRFEWAMNTYPSRQPRSVHSSTSKRAVTPRVCVCSTTSCRTLKRSCSH